MYTPYNIFQFPWTNAFQTLRQHLTYFCQTAHMPNPKATSIPFPTNEVLSHTSKHPHLSPFPYKLVPRSLHGGRTPVATESLFHCVLSEQGGQEHEKWAERESSVKLGMLSSAFIHFCDLSSIWILGTWYHLLNYF